MLDHLETGRRKGVFLFCAAAFSSTIAVALASVAHQIGQPYPGFFVWENLVVPALATGESPENSSAIPFRAVLTEVDGHPLRDAAELREAVGAVPAGTPLQYTFLRDGVTIQKTVPTTVLRWRDVAPVHLPYLLIGVAFFATGLIIFYFRPGLPAAHASLMLGVTLGGTLVLALDTLSSYWMERLYFMVESLIPAALLHFALSFPEEKEIARRRGSKLLLYAPFVILGVLQNLGLHHSPAAHLAVNDWVYSAIAAAGLAAIASLLYSYATSKDPLARQQARVVAAGGALAAVVPSLGLLSIIVAGMKIPMNFLSPFFLIFPLSIAYAIARHNLFDVDRYLRLGVVYAALTAVFFAGYAALVVGMERWSGAARRLPEGAVPLYLLAVLLVLEPLRARVQRVVDRLFYRQRYSYRATVESTSRALASILDSDRITKVVLETVTDVMAIEWGAICVFGNSLSDVRTYARPAAVGVTLEERLRLHPQALAAAVRRRKLWTRYDQPWRRADVEDAEPLAALEATVLLPATFEEKTIALMALGERKSGALFASEDLDLIQTLANQTALALENAHAYEVIQHTQQELVRAERLAAIGELSAAVAHGIRNPLAGIRAAAQVAREDPEDVDTVRENLEDIIGEADRLESRVRTLLDFARPFEPTLAATDINLLIADFANDVRKRVPAQIVFSTSLDPSLPRAVADKVQMIEILEALVVNALEAMNGRGKMEIRTAYEREAARPIVLSVVDNGPGIEPKHRGRLFELFYTTKPSGTGIGLATVRKLVEKQGGEIDVRSAVGVGTTFIVRLRTFESG